MRKIAGCASTGNAGNVFPATGFRGSGENVPFIGSRLLISDPGIHHGTCVTHVPWCISGSLTRGGEENVPGIPGACATRNIMYLVRCPWPTHCGDSPSTVGPERRIESHGDGVWRVVAAFKRVIEISGLACKGELDWGLAITLLQLNSKTIWWMSVRP